MSIFFTDFFSSATDFHQSPVLISITVLKYMLFFFNKKKQTSRGNSSKIRWIRNAKFFEYRFKSTRTYLARFSNVLVYCKVLNALSQICIISFFPGKLLSVDSFLIEIFNQKLNFCIS